MYLRLKNGGFLMGFASIFNYCNLSTAQTRADALLAMLREAPDAFNEETALEFISRGIAHKNAPDMLTWAALRGRTSVVCALIDKNIVKVDASDEYGDMALLNACYAGEHDTIKALKKRNANATLTREQYKCAFYFAEKSKVPGTYELMINLYPKEARSYEIAKDAERKKFVTQNRAPQTNVIGLRSATA